MKITKFVHSCLLVEMPDPVNRTALFDPGVYSEEALNVSALQFLDDIIITHKHADHFSVPLVKQLVGRFPDVHIMAPAEVTAILQTEGITATSSPSPGLVLFDSPHEAIRPLSDMDAPQNIGVHYLDLLTHPGDSHSFNETKNILALPVQAPWGSTVRAVELALALKPQYIVPIHDWHWNEDNRAKMYNRMDERFAQEGITFHKLETGLPVVINV